MPETGRYLYAVSRDLAAADLDGLVGLTGGHVETVPCDEIVGVVSSVDLAEFGEESLRTNLERLDWLSDVARTHDAVVQAVAARAPVAPMRLATIFADDAAIAARLRATYDGLVAALDRVEGRHEWSVKVLVPDGAAVTADAQPPVSGADYLRRKRAEAYRRATATESGAALAVRVHEAVAAGSVASRRLAAQDRQLSGHTGTMVLNGAYLVADREAEAFEEIVAALRRDHPAVTIGCEGPWPPYSFAVLDES